MAGAPVGNQNAKKAKRWQSALSRALAKVANGQGFEAGLDLCADQLVKSAVAGEQWALREIGDRFDGKPTQVIGGDEDQPLIIKEIVIRAIDATTDRSPKESD